MSARPDPGASCSVGPANGRPARHPGAVTALLSVALVLLALLLGGCGSDAPSAARQVVPTATPQIVDGVQVFDVVGTAALEFSPATLIARPGKITVNLTVPAGSAPHNFVIADIPAAKTNFASQHTPQSVTFSVDKPGKYPYICTIHPNMRGTLTII